MYELIILGFLMLSPVHGYLIAKSINGIIGPYAKFSSGRLYPLLRKLEQDALIEAVTDETTEMYSKRRQRKFRITDRGRERFHELMMDTTSNPGDYQSLFWQKVALFDFIDPKDRMFLIDHYIHYCQTHIYHDIHQTEKREYLDEETFGKSQLKNIQTVLEHYKHQWQFELEQVNELRDKEMKGQNHI